MAASKSEKKNAYPTHKSTQLQLFWKHGFDPTKHTSSPNICLLCTAFYKRFFHCMKLAVGPRGCSSLHLPLDICTRYVPRTCWRRAGTRGGKGDEQEKSAFLSIQRSRASFCCTLNLKHCFNPCWAQLLSVTVFRAFYLTLIFVSTPSTVWLSTSKGNYLRRSQTFP